MTDYKPFPDGNYFGEKVQQNTNGLSDVTEAAMILGNELRELTNRLTFLFLKSNTEHVEYLQSMEPVRSDPAADGFEDDVEDLAGRLWETDQTKTSGARRFEDDYGVIQDRYRTQARLLLDPSEGMER